MKCDYTKRSWDMGQLRGPWCKQPLKWCRRWMGASSYKPSKDLRLGVNNLCWMDERYIHIRQLRLVFACGPNVSARQTTQHTKDAILLGLVMWGMEETFCSLKYAPYHSHVEPHIMVLGSHSPQPRQMRNLCGWWTMHPLNNGNHNSTLK